MVTKPQKYRDIARFLRSQGWEKLREAKGSHEWWGNPNGPGRISIPAHGEVSAGIVRQLITAFPDSPKSWR